MMNSAHMRPSLNAGIAGPQISEVMEEEHSESIFAKAKLNRSLHKKKLQSSQSLAKKRKRCVSDEWNIIGRTPSDDDAPGTTKASVAASPASKPSSSQGSKSSSGSGSQESTTKEVEGSQGKKERLKDNIRKVDTFENAQETEGTQEYVVPSDESSEDMQYDIMTCDPSDAARGEESQGDRAEVLATETDSCILGRACGSARVGLPH